MCIRDRENHIDFQLTRSAAYDTLFEAVCDDLRARCGAAEMCIRDRP